MRDIGLLVSLLSLASLALWRPWLGVLALAFFGFTQPHSYADGFMRDFPVYWSLLGATLVGALFTRERSLPPRDWRVAALLLFWLGMLLSTYHALFPNYAWPRFEQVSAVLASTVLILVLIDTRQKLFLLLATIALAFALVTIKGGYWAVIYGFGDRVYGPPGSQYHDNNAFAVAAVMTIPLLLLWLRQSGNAWLQGLLGVIIALSVLAALSSWSRGGLLALGTMGLLLLLASTRRMALGLVPLAVVALVAVFCFFPEQWLERMQSIASYETDGSAQGRLEVWQRGLGFIERFPFFGTGFESWTYGERFQDWHSAYIEVAVEQGLVGFTLWLSLILGSLAGLTKLAWRFGNAPETAWIRDYSVTLRASIGAYCVGSAFLGIAYWDLLFHLIAAAILLQALAHQEAA
ncbi:MAG: putative O-glycosylation ligase, exosortase A system-associated, partial [Halieaceae bacterium]|nr:putative O-glycosylation ligase, exosortase A system-associated [Halieaceae bacterium]